MREKSLQIAWVLQSPTLSHGLLVLDKLESASRRPGGMLVETRLHGSPDNLVLSLSSST